MPSVPRSHKILLSKLFALLNAQDATRDSYYSWRQELHALYAKLSDNLQDKLANLLLKNCGLHRVWKYPAPEKLVTYEGSWYFLTGEGLLYHQPHRQPLLITNDKAQLERLNDFFPDIRSEQLSYSQCHQITVITSHSLTKLMSVVHYLNEPENVEAKAQLLLLNPDEITRQHPVFTCLHQVIAFIHALIAQSPDLGVILTPIVQDYEQTIDLLVRVSPEERVTLLTPPAQLMVECPETREPVLFQIPQALARQLTCVDKQGGNIKPNSSGSHDVIALGGVHFKSSIENPRGEQPSGYLNVGIERMLYLFSEVLGFDCFAPVVPLKIEGVLLHDVVTPVGRCVQASLSAGQLSLEAWLAIPPLLALLRQQSALVRVELLALAEGAINPYLNNPPQNTYVFLTKANPRELIYYDDAKQAHSLALDYSLYLLRAQPNDNELKKNALYLWRAEDKLFYKCITPKNEIITAEMTDDLLDISAIHDQDSLEANKAAILTITATRKHTAKLVQIPFLQNLGERIKDSNPVIQAIIDYHQTTPIVSERYFALLNFLLSDEPRKQAIQAYPHLANPTTAELLDIYNYFLEKEILTDRDGSLLDMANVRAEGKREQRLAVFEKMIGTHYEAAVFIYGVLRCYPDLAQGMVLKDIVRIDLLSIYPVIKAIIALYPGADAAQVTQAIGQWQAMLDRDNFAAHCILTCLIPPTDARYDNYRVDIRNDAKGHPQSFHIIGIDNDEISDKSVEVKSSGFHWPVLKSVILGFPMMKECVPLSVRQRLLRYKPHEFITQWATLLMAEETRYANWRHVVDMTVPPIATFALSLLPNPALLTLLYAKLSKLQQLLTDKPTLTYVELLTHLELVMGPYYQKATQDFQANPIDSYRLIAGNHQTPKSAVETILAGHEQLNTLCEILTLMTAPALAENPALDWDSFHPVKGDKQKQAIFYDQLLSLCLPWMAHSMVELDLSPCAALLTNSRLAELLHQYPNIKKLNLRGCIHLNVMTLFALLQQQVPQLEVLGLDDNPQLTSVHFSRKAFWQLKQLSLQNCSALVSMNLSAYQRVQRLAGDSPKQCEPDTLLLRIKEGSCFVYWQEEGMLMQRVLPVATLRGFKLPKPGAASRDSRLIQYLIAHYKIPFVEALPQLELLFLQGSPALQTCLFGGRRLFFSPFKQAILAAVAIGDWPVAGRYLKNLEALLPFLLPDDFKNASVWVNRFRLSQNLPKQQPVFSMRPADAETLLSAHYQGELLYFSLNLNQPGFTGDEVELQQQLAALIQDSQAHLLLWERQPNSTQLILVAEYDAGLSWQQQHWLRAAGTLQAMEITRRPVILRQHYTTAHLQTWLKAYEKVPVFPLLENSQLNSSQALIARNQENALIPTLSQPPVVIYSLPEAVSQQYSEEKYIDYGQPLRQVLDKSVRASKKQERSMVVLLQMPRKEWVLFIIDKENKLKLPHSLQQNAEDADSRLKGYCFSCTNDMDWGEWVTSHWLQKQEDEWQIVMPNGDVPQLRLTSIEPLAFYATLVNFVIDAKSIQKLLSQTAVQTKERLFIFTTDNKLYYVNRTQKQCWQIQLSAKKVQQWQKNLRLLSGSIQPVSQEQLQHLEKGISKLRLEEISLNQTPLAVSASPQRVSSLIGKMLFNHRTVRQQLARQVKLWKKRHHNPAPLDYEIFYWTDASTPQTRWYFCGYTADRSLIEGEPHNLPELADLAEVLEEKQPLKKDDLTQAFHRAVTASILQGLYPPPAVAPEAAQALVVAENPAQLPLAPVLWVKGTVQIPESLALWQSGPWVQQALMHYQQLTEETPLESFLAQLGQIQIESSDFQPILPSSQNPAIRWAESKPIAITPTPLNIEPVVTNQAQSLLLPKSQINLHPAENGAKSDGLRIVSSYDTVEAFLIDVIENYVDAMKKPGQYWGGDIELGVIARLNSIRIHVDDLRTGKTTKIEDDNDAPVLHLQLDSGHYSLCTVDEARQKTIHLINPDGDCLFTACHEGLERLKNADYQPRSCLPLAELTAFRQVISEELESNARDSIFERYQAIIEAETEEHYEAALADLYRAPCIEETKAFRLYRQQSALVAVNALPTTPMPSNIDSDLSEIFALSDPSGGFLEKPESSAPQRVITEHKIQPDNSQIQNDQPPLTVYHQLSSLLCALPQDKERWRLIMQTHPDWRAQRAQAAHDLWLHQARLYQLKAQLAFFSCRETGYTVHLLSVDKAANLDAVLQILHSPLGMADDNALRIRLWSVVGKEPILIKQADNIFMYGYHTDGQWKITSLSAEVFSTLHFPEIRAQLVVASPQALTLAMYDDIAAKAGHTPFVASNQAVWFGYLHAQAAHYAQKLNSPYMNFLWQVSGLSPKAQIEKVAVLLDEFTLLSPEILYDHVIWSVDKALVINEKRRISLELACQQGYCEEAERIWQQAVEQEWQVSAKIAACDSLEFAKHLKTYHELPAQEWLSLEEQAFLAHSLPLLILQGEDERVVDLLRCCQQWLCSQAGRAVLNHCMAAKDRQRGRNLYHTLCQFEAWDLAQRFLAVSLELHSLQQPDKRGLLAHRQLGQTTGNNWLYFVLSSTKQAWYSQRERALALLPVINVLLAQEDSLFQHNSAQTSAYSLLEASDMPEALRDLIESMLLNTEIERRKPMMRLGGESLRTMLLSDLPENPARIALSDGEQGGSLSEKDYLLQDREVPTGQDNESTNWEDSSFHSGSMRSRISLSQALQSAISSEILESNKEASTTTAEMVNISGHEQSKAPESQLAGDRFVEQWVNGYLGIEELLQHAVLTSPPEVKEEPNTLSFMQKAQLFLGKKIPVTTMQVHALSLQDNTDISYLLALRAQIRSQLLKVLIGLRLQNGAAVATTLKHYLSAPPADKLYNQLGEAGRAGFEIDSVLREMAQVLLREHELAGVFPVAAQLKPLVDSEEQEGSRSQRKSMPSEQLSKASKKEILQLVYEQKCQDEERERREKEQERQEKENALKIAEEYKIKYAEEAKRSQELEARLSEIEKTIHHKADEIELDVGSESDVIVLLKVAPPVEDGAKVKKFKEKKTNFSIFVAVSDNPQEAKQGEESVVVLEEEDTAGRYDAYLNEDPPSLSPRGLKKRLSYSDSD